MADQTGGGMTTSIKKTRDGTILSTEERKKPTGKGTTIFPVPTNIPVGASSLLALSLEETSGTAKALRVRSTPIRLPGGPTATWTLQHLAYTTGLTRPTPDAWGETPVSADGFSILLSDPLPLATHVFRLRRIEGGITDCYTETSIMTPSRGTPFFPSSGLLTPALKPVIVSYWNDFRREKATLIEPAIEGVSGADAWAVTGGYRFYYQALNAFLLSGLVPHYDWSSLAVTNEYTAAKTSAIVLTRSDSSTVDFYDAFPSLVGATMDQVFYHLWGAAAESFTAYRDALLDALCDAMREDA